jgi:hypothetical protein
MVDLAVKLPELLRVSSTIVLLLGALITAVGAAIWWSSSRQMNWTPVDAEILKSGLEIGGSRTQHSAQWQIAVEYRYRVNGQPYTSSDYSSSALPSSTARDGAQPSEELRKLVARYPVGSTVKAYVSPRNPANAMLVIPARPVYSVAVFGVVLMLVGLVVRMRYLR